MRSFFKNPKFLQRSSVLFIIAAVSLLAVSMVHVDCPICSSIVTDSSEAGSKILEIKAERVDFTIDHAYCGDFLIQVDYIVEISLVNEGFESSSVPLFITGRIPEEGLGKEVIKKTVKLIYVELLGKETKRIQEHVTVYMFGDAAIGDYSYKAGFADVPRVEFSVITDPDEIRTNCPICQGKGNILLTERLRVSIQ